MAQYIEVPVSKKGKEKTDTKGGGKLPETPSSPVGQNPALRSKRLI
jgi:hypothetical protein